LRGHIDRLDTKSTGQSGASGSPLAGAHKAHAPSILNKSGTVETPTPRTRNPTPKAAGGNQIACKSPSRSERGGGATRSGRRGAESIPRPPRKKKQEMIRTHLLQGGAWRSRRRRRYGEGSATGGRGDCPPAPLVCFLFFGALLQWRYCGLAMSTKATTSSAVAGNGENP
jgi:hypothetical protein